jgi:hypothetical protein
MNFFKHPELISSTASWGSGSATQQQKHSCSNPQLSSNPVSPFGSVEVPGGQWLGDDSELSNALHLCSLVTVHLSSDSVPRSQIFTQALREALEVDVSTPRG